MKKKTLAQIFSCEFLQSLRTKYFVNGLLKQHVSKYAHVFFGIHVLQEHR